MLQVHKKNTLLNDYDDDEMLRVLQISEKELNIDYE